MIFAPMSWPLSRPSSANPRSISPTRRRRISSRARLLLDAAFGPDRFEKTGERLREGRLPAAGLALVMKHGPLLVGTLRLWHVDAGGAEP